MSQQIPISDDSVVLANEIYDLIMCEIEPDLLKSNVPNLAAKYAGETPAEHEVRMERYAAAYLKFDEEAAKFMSDVEQSARAAERVALKEKEAKNLQVEQIALNSLASAFN